MSNRAITGLAFLLLVQSSVFAAEPTTKPLTTADAITLLTSRVDALEQQVGDLKQQLAVAKADPKALATPKAATTQNANSWVIKVTSVTAPSAAASEQEMMTLQIKLTGGQSGQSQSSAAFTQGASSVNSQARNELTQNNPRSAPPQIDQRSSVQVNRQASGSSGMIGPGSSAMYHDDSIESRLSAERSRLQSMQGDFEYRRDPNGISQRVNRYSNADIGRQQLVVQQLETEKTRTQQRILTLQREIEKANSSVMITGVTDDGLAATASASIPAIAAMARNLQNGQRVRIDGTTTRRTPVLEITIRSLIPLE